MDIVNEFLKGLIKKFKLIEYSLKKEKYFKKLMTFFITLSQKKHEICMSNPNCWRKLVILCLCIIVVARHSPK